MVEISPDTLNGIDVLHATPSGQQEYPLPTIFFFHGYTLSKEVYAYFGYALAQVGFVLFCLTRRCTARVMTVMRPAVYAISGIFCNLTCRNCRGRWIADEKIGVAGASLGGMTALASMTRYPWISAVASFMGSGYFSALSRSFFPPVPTGSPGSDDLLRQLAQTLANYDVTDRLSALANRPLLLWHGRGARSR